MGKLLEGVTEATRSPKMRFLCRSEKGKMTWIVIKAKVWKKEKLT